MRVILDVMDKDDFRRGLDPNVDVLRVGISVRMRPLLEKHARDPSPKTPSLSRHRSFRCSDTSCLRPDVRAKAGPR